MDRNLSPYGHSVPTELNQGAWSQDYLAAAFERARFKVSNVAPEAPVGPDGAYQVYAYVNLGVGLLWLALAFVALAATGEPIGLSIWPFILIAACFFWFGKYRNSKPDTPERALHAWIGALNRKKWERVDRLRVHTDRDAFPRRIATLQGALEMPMSNVAELKQYWQELRTRLGMHNGRWILKKVFMQPRGHGMAIVTGELSVPRVKQIYALVAMVLFGVGIVVTVVMAAADKMAGSNMGVIMLLGMAVALLAALIVLAQRRKLPNRKIAVFNGQEWRMLSGEWQAPEDNDLRWMQ